MINIRRYFTLAVCALGLATATGSPHAATNAETAHATVKAAQATIHSFENNKTFTTFREALANAKGVLIFPKVLKAGFILGGAGGTGVLMVRDESTGHWVGPAFYTMSTASLGLQAGASSAEMVMIVQTQKALDSLYTNKIKLGGDASWAVWKEGMGTAASLGVDFIAYSAVKGAFAGVSIDGSVLDVRESLNHAFYGKPVTPADILVKRGVSSHGSAGLQDALMKAAKMP